MVNRWQLRNEIAKIEHEIALGYVIFTFKYQQTWKSSALGNVPPYPVIVT